MSIRRIPLVSTVIMYYKKRLSELQLQGLAIDELVVRDTEAVEGFALQRDALDGTCGRACLLDDDVAIGIIARIEMQRHAVEDGCGDAVIRRAGTVGIDSHHREDEPGRHRAAVVVAGNAVGLVGVMSTDQVADDLLCAPLFAWEIVEEIGVGDVWLVGRVVEPLVEHHLQLLDELLPPAHQACQSGYVVGYIEGIVPRRTLVESGSIREVGTRLGVEGSEERAVHLSRSECAVFLRVVVTVAETLAVEAFRICLTH